MGGYLAGQSEIEHYETVLKRGYNEIENMPDIELKEVEDIFIEMSVEISLSKQVALQVSKDKDRWVDVMMKLQLSPYIIFKDSKTVFFYVS